MPLLPKEDRAALRPTDLEGISQRDLAKQLRLSPDRRQESSGPFRDPA